jgi:HEAT repeat protein
MQTSNPQAAPVLQMAKWPPDDVGGPGLQPSQGGGGYGGGDDGNFKRGAVKPAIVIVTIALLLGGAAAAYLGIKGESDKLSTEQIAAEKKSIVLLPKAEQLPKWRAWAARGDAPMLQQEAFVELAWEKDLGGLSEIVKGLGSDDHRVRGTAAQALLEYGSPQADGAKPALMKALAESDASDKPQICWALATLKEAAAFDQVLAEYRQGHLANVQRADGAPAFDPEVLASMVTLDKLATLAGDASESVRQLVATVVSRNAEPKWTGVLTKLVQDPVVDVAREAAVGLGKIANDEAMGPLIGALGRADKDSRARFLEALRDGIGTKGLVLALRTVSKQSYEREKHQNKVIFDMIRELEDPRGGDALLEYLSTASPKPHWKTEAALRMAEIGDVRAAPSLAWRLNQDPLKLYNKVDDPELMTDDNERVVSARMLADLAILFPDKRDKLLADAEDAVINWITDKPQPHANGLRFLAAAGSRKILPRLRTWSDPKVRFPEPGAQPPIPLEWETVQSALRYEGWTKDPQGWSILERQMFRHGKKKYDITEQGLMQGGLAVMGMTIRALGVGASHGFAQWGDSKAYPLFIKYIEDKENNESARAEACFGLSWVASDEQMKEVVKKVHDFNKADPKDQVVRGCYLETLIRRPVPEATAGLIDLLRPDQDMEVRHQVARAIGFGGVTRAMIPQIFDKLKDPNLRSDAALALLLGADADTAMRALASYNEAAPEAIEELKVIYDRTFGYWSDRNYENGDVARWIENAEACRHVKVHDALQDWPKLILSRGIQGIEFDNGPHSLTRVQLRVRLYQDAKGGNDAKRANAIRTLKFLKEKGVLMALKNEAGAWQDAAKKAFFEVMNPKITTDKLPEAQNAKASGANVVAPK